MNVFLCAPSVSVCTYGVFHLYMYICIYLHTHIKHTRKHACLYLYHTLYMHTRCLSILIGMDVHIYTHTYKPRYVYIYLYAHTLHLMHPQCPFTNIYTYIYIPIHTCTNSDMNACNYTHAYIYVKICTHTCVFSVHVCQYMHTYM